MENIAIIPARMASSRFPGKPMAKIHGIPMIGHCYLRTKMAKSLTETYVATCDQEIYNYIESIGGKAVMTKDTHERCTDRTAEAVQKIEKQTGKQLDIVVIVQGDEPMVVPEMLDEAVVPLLADKSIQVVNLVSELKNQQEHEDPNEVKVVVDRDNNAMYFSREPIPSWKKGGKDFPMLKQVCIIPFRRDFLFQYMEMEPTMLEIVESVDMNRILENGFKIKMIRTTIESYAVDTPEDLAKVEIRMQNDPLMASYISGSVHGE